jgi:hypothetical protein
VQAELARSGAPAADDVRFDIVAHSMGGLVARYYLQYGAADLPADGSAPPITWAGARRVDRLIQVGTPNAGSVHALEDLAHGVEFAPILPRYDAAILGTMPAVYQLLPRVRHARVVADGDGAEPLDIYDVDLWVRMRWGLADPGQDRVLAVLLPETGDPDARRAIALDHLRKCLDRARRLAEALDVPVNRPQGLDIHLFLGDATATYGVLAVDPRGRIRVGRSSPGTARSPAQAPSSTSGSEPPGRRGWSPRSTGAGSPSSSRVTWGSPPTRPSPTTCCTCSWRQQDRTAGPGPGTAWPGAHRASGCRSEAAKSTSPRRAYTIPPPHPTRRRPR